MKRIAAIVAALIMCLAAASCAPKEKGTEVIVFAAASMTETLTEIAELYKAAEPNVALIFNFDSSGTLKTQIQEGAECDLFISAGQKQMDELDAVKEGTRKDLLENRVALCVPEGNPKGIASFDQLAELLKSGEILFAMGNADVPVGQYTRKIFAYYGLDEAAAAAQGKITYGTNAKEVTTQIVQGAVDCGVVYCTDAFSADLEIVDYAAAEMCGQVIYPAAVMNNAAHPEQARAFLDYLMTDEAMAVFERVGFAGAK